MDFFSKVKRAFGFAEDGSDFEDELNVDARTTPYVNPFRNDNLRTSDTSAPAQSEQSDKTAHDADVAALKQQMQQMMAMMRQMQHAPQQQAPTTHTDTAAGDDDASELKQRLTASETQRRAAQNRANSLLEKIEELQVRITTLENDKKGLLNKIRVMQVKAGGDGGTQTTDAIEKMMEQHHEELDAKDREIANLKANIEENRLATLESAKQVEQLNKTIVEQKQTNEALSRSLDEARANLQATEGLRQAATQARDREQHLTTEIERLKTQVAEIQVEKNNIEQERQAVIAQAEAKNAQLQKDINRLNAQARDVAEKHKRRDIDVANHIDALKQQLAAAADITRQNRAKLEQQSTQINELTALHANAQTELKQVRASLTVANAQAVQLRGEAEKAYATLEQKDKELARVTQELNEANESLAIAAEVQQQLEQVEQFKTKKNDEIARLKKRIKELEQKLAVTPQEEPAPKPEKKKDKRNPTPQQPTSAKPEPVNPKSEPNHPQPEPVNKSPKPTPDPFAGIADDLDDIDWLLPVEPDQPEPQIVAEEPEPLPKAQPDPRQLSLF